MTKYSYLYGEGTIAASNYLTENSQFDFKAILNTTIVELSTHFAPKSLKIIYAANSLCLQQTRTLENCKILTDELPNSDLYKIFVLNDKILSNNNLMELIDYFKLPFHALSCY